MNTPVTPLTADNYWSADQLRVMRGLELPTWFLPVAHVPHDAPALTSQPIQVEVASEPETEIVKPNAAVHVLQDLSELDLPALSQAASQCQACPLSQSSCRKPLALNMAQTKAQWLIVVDDALMTDALLSEPAQRLLSAMLASVGKSMDAVSVTSLLKCGRNAEMALDAYSDEVQACQPFLRQHIALVQPSLVIAMGELAAQALVGVDDELSQLVGEIHEYEGLPLLVVHHPETLMAHPQLKAQVWRDLNTI